ncbi:hypothetical protein O6H91_18G051700 [Diphasiastrum complanatum]|nr:hypothetical protein O6H91_18G051700 [Diphasiastrum complanatum]
MLEMWREKRMNPFGILYSWFLAKVANKLEVFPGAEFRVAYEEALACGAKVTLGDRPVQITLRRTWARMSIWHKIKLIFALSTQAFFLPSVEDINRMLEEMSDSDMITLLIQEMSKSFPTLMETLVDERDLFMTAILQKVARHHSSIVVVVGKGHMPGIIRNWGKDIKIDSLLEIPQRSSRSLYLKRWGTVALAIGGLAIISGIYFSKKR